ncbi:MAG: aspartate aminotransferase family protein, partial [candidate division NC10 bacterium]|nr:aspartate aminotransferase family protein [candidate division NC10 bacterium]
MDLLERDFRRYVCQTSDEPFGIVVERTEGCSIIARDGKRYLDFLAGIGV